MEIIPNMVVYAIPARALCAGTPLLTWGPVLHFVRCLVIRAGVPQLDANNSVPDQVVCRQMEWPPISEGKTRNGVAGGEKGSDEHTCWCCDFCRCHSLPICPFHHDDKARVSVPNFTMRENLQGICIVSTFFS